MRIARRRRAPARRKIVAQVLEISATRRKVVPRHWRRCEPTDVIASDSDAIQLKPPQQSESWMASSLRSSQ
jgi:hypothetical protein